MRATRVCRVKASHLPPADLDPSRSSRNIVTNEIGPYWLWRNCAWSVKTSSPVRPGRRLPHHAVSAELRVRLDSE